MVMVRDDGDDVTVETFFTNYLYRLYSESICTPATPILTIFYAVFVYRAFILFTHKVFVYQLFRYYFLRTIFYAVMHTVSKKVFTYIQL